MCLRRRSTMEGDGVLPQVKEREAKTEDLNSIPKLHILEEKNNFH